MRSLILRVSDPGEAGGAVASLLPTVRVSEADGGRGHPSTGSPRRRNGRGKRGGDEVRRDRDREMRYTMHRKGESSPRLKDSTSTHTYITRN